jgi:putative transposase
MRVEFSGGLYHVTARGNGRQPIFVEEPDHEAFLTALTSVVARYHVRCHAYCLMGNHYHLLLETPVANLSCAMRQLNGVYSQAFNHRHRRSGHVFEGRFQAQVVDKDAYLRAVCRYIVLNPVRAGLVAHPRQWAWSSYRATAGEAPLPAFLTVDWVLSLGDTPVGAAAEDRYRRFIDAGLAGTLTPLRPASSPLVVGDATRVTPLREQVCAAATNGEIPRAQRFVLRPLLSAIFAGSPAGVERDLCCARAVREHGYTLRAVAAYLGVHYSTVSRALARGERQLSA